MLKIISLGKRSSIAATVIAVSYGVLQILFSFHFIPHPDNLYWFLIPSLLFAPLFLITVICFDLLTPAQSRKWTTVAWVIGTINCTMITLVYLFQVTSVNRQLFIGEAGHFRVPLLEDHSVLSALEYMAYFLVSASTFVLAFAIKNLNAKQLYRSLLVNGILLPVLIFSWFYPRYHFLNYIWMVTFPLATMQACQFFKVEERELKKKEKRMKGDIEWIIH
jgi:hypothetical protein